MGYFEEIGGAILSAIGKINRKRRGALCLIVAATMLSVLAISVAVIPAFADESSGSVVTIDEDMGLVVGIDENGALELRGLELDGIVVPVGESFVETESMLSALAATYNGWYKSNTGTWYYFVNGKWATGWKKIDGYWYYFKSTGEMLKGWQKVGGSWFYLRTAKNTPTAGPEGSMVVDWIRVGGYWYCLAGPASGVGASSPDYGKMLKGLHQVGTYEYFFYDGSLIQSGFSFPEGAMCTSINYAEILGPDGILVYATIDSEGHVHKHGIYRALATQSSDESAPLASS